MDIVYKGFVYCFSHDCYLDIDCSIFFCLHSLKNFYSLTYRASPLLIHLFPFPHIFLFVLQASRLTAAARKFKQTCLQVRVFGYPSASQLDLDSFVLFSHSAEMKVGVLGNLRSRANFFLTVTISMARN